MSRGRKPKRGLYWGAKLKCLRCETVIQSAHVHDWVACKCPNGVGVWIDGGGEYCRMGCDIGHKYEILDPGNYRDAGTT
jgi:Zn-finger nucleic acid-binding protein